MATVLYCRCDLREKAQRYDFFRYSPTYGGWIFPDDPRRTMSKEAVTLAFTVRCEFDHVDHTGEPTVWTCCPFCGGDLAFTKLPPLSDEIEWILGALGE